jgi:sec-independent protein translocase protein TatC
MDDTRLTFQEHLGELRTRLVRMAYALLAGVIVAWTARRPLFDFLSGPVREGLADHGIYQLTAIEVSETMFVYVKLALVGGIVVASPVLFHQLWAFISPGLHRHEKQHVVPVTVFSVLFFVLGVLFCHRVLLPFVTDWLTALTLDHPNVDMQVTVSNAFSFSLNLLLAFGVAFELPLLLFFLSLLGVATPQRLMRFFRYFVVLAFVIGAVFTPPEPVSQAMMAGPLVVLYLVGVALSALVTRQRARGVKGAIPLRSWLAVGAALLGIAAGIGWLSWRIGLAPSPLDHVPASARAVAGLRWSDARSRTALLESMARWAAAHPEAPAPQAVLARLGLTEVGADAPDVSEIVWFETYDGRHAALVAGALGEDPLAAAAARLGADWTLRAAPDGVTVLARADADLSRPDALVARRVAADVVAVGEQAAVAAGERDDAARAGITAVAHRRAAIEGVRRAGPLWLLVWPDPLLHQDWYRMVAGTWDRPIVQASTTLLADVTVHATLLAPSPGAAARLAREIDEWREAQAARELQAAAERARRADSRRTTERLERLAALVDDSLRGTRAALAAAARDDVADSALREPLARLEVLRAEFRAETAAEAAADATPVVAGPVRAGDVARLEASAEGPLVSVVVSLTPTGAAAAADWVVGWLGGLETLPAWGPEATPRESADAAARREGSAADEGRTAGAARSEEE